MCETFWIVPAPVASTWRTLRTAQPMPLLEISTKSMAMLPPLFQDVWLSGMNGCMVTSCCTCALTQAACAHVSTSIPRPLNLWTLLAQYLGVMTYNALQGTARLGPISHEAHGRALGAQALLHTPRRRQLAQRPPLTMCSTKAYFGLLWRGGYLSMQEAWPPQKRHAVAPGRDGLRAAGAHCLPEVLTVQRKAAHPVSTSA